MFWLKANHDLQKIKMEAKYLHDYRVEKQQVQHPLPLVPMSIEYPTKPVSQHYIPLSFLQSKSRLSLFSFFVFYLYKWRTETSD